LQTNRDARVILTKVSCKVLLLDVQKIFNPSASANKKSIIKMRSGLRPYIYREFDEGMHMFFPLANIL